MLFLKYPESSAYNFGGAIAATAKCLQDNESAYPTKDLELPSELLLQAL